MDMIKAATDHDQMSLQVRQYIATQCHEMLGALRPYINGDFGDIAPGHVQAAVRVLHELGALYQAHSRPYEAPEEKGVPVAKVQQMLSELQERHSRDMQAAVAAAVADAVERERLELAARERLSLAAGRDAVRRQLVEVQARIS